MCGIAGIYNWETAASQREAVRAMTDRLSRRGPDGAGLHAELGLALGHRRLSIIDLSERGGQPMSNEDGTVWLTFNGEIYNYRELRRRLESQGHTFKSDADSETLVHLYEESADDLSRFLEQVRGMFALAIWDRRRQRLLLARDRLGIKPLFYYLGDSFIAFASDIGALTACAEVPRRIDWTSLYEYLVLLTVPGPNTMLRDVRHLGSGRMLLVERGLEREIIYWRLEAQSGDQITDVDEADEALGEALAESVKSHLVADVEVGAFLSGGIDSGIVTAFAAEHAGHTLTTFSATFPGEQVDEGQWAREASEKIGSHHTEFSISGGFLDDIERVVEVMDQPMALTSAVSLFHLARLARERVKVVLTGDGGDELFAGYNRHRPYPAPGRAVGWVPRGARQPLGKIGRAALPEWARGRSQVIRKAYALSAALARDEAGLYAPRLYYMQPDEALSLIPPCAISQVDTGRYLDRVRGLFEQCRYADLVSRMLFIDLQTSLADEMLAKVDRMTMAWGLEARVPLLDHRVVEIGMRIAGKVKRSGETGKLPLRRLTAQRLGGETGWRAKHGFNSPIENWLRDDQATRAKLNWLWPAVERSGALDKLASRAFKEEFEKGGQPNAMSMLALLVYGLWAEHARVEAA
jgi:asparagine synthase (glutamine-hydrolysing)